MHTGTAAALALVLLSLAPFLPFCESATLPYSKANPIIYDNDSTYDVYTDDYLMALATAGDISLRGMITSTPISPHNPWVSVNGFNRMVTRRTASVASARASGWTNIPNPVAGVMGHLTKPGSGLIADTVPIGSTGSSLIVIEALAASPSLPLVVIAGGTLTTIADAYLQNPAIANNIIVAFIGGQPVFPYRMADYNGWLDGWAAHIVVRTMRTVIFPIFGSRSPAVPTAQLWTLPDTPLRAFMIAKNSQTPAPGGIDADAPPAIGIMAANYVTAQQQVSYAGMWMTQNPDGPNYEVPYFANNVSGLVGVVTGINTTVSTTEWWRAMRRAFR